MMLPLKPDSIYTSAKMIEVNTGIKLRDFQVAASRAGDYTAAYSATLTLSTLSR